MSAFPFVRLLAACALGLLLHAAAHAEPAGEPHPGAVAPIGPDLCDEMRARNVMTPISPVSCDRLRLVTFAYSDFEGRMHDKGEIVVLDTVADSVLRIFIKLRAMQFPIAKVRLMNHYDGNDSASTRDNNTSSFNARKSTGGSSLSMHAYGLAIDLNPVQNPYATLRSDSSRNYAPKAGAAYANRSVDRATQLRSGMAEAVIDVFADEGFNVWGGYWHNPTDYQHFQVNRPMAERLASLSPQQASAEFKRYVERYRICRKSAGPETSRLRCIAER